MSFTDQLRQEVFSGTTTIYDLTGQQKNQWISFLEGLVDGSRMCKDSELEFLATVFKEVINVQ